ncbi:hypothetical protein CSA56_11045 [candidate division KSB3 bacterium]|uniref:Carbohydrate-binding domain-containing protein n=1 Tax=candidate division KSB3 bacterium TaxID=2044937 RepID=A0A2G6KD80_9BACT|nr:MAG: hypothetical protein CSA56_11045 [candidate division KSB3 bacterium]
MNYTIHRTETSPPLDRWDDTSWQQADTLQVSSFHPRSSRHRPITEVKLLYDSDHLYIFFRVVDRYVTAIHTNYQAMVCNDSCVESFIMPAIFRADTFLSPSPPRYQGYFNIEINCIGTMLLYYIADWRRTADGFEKYAPVPAELARGINIVSSLPTTPIEKEITSPLEWHIGYEIPFSIFEHYLGPLDFWRNRPWLGNFYKCGDQTSHPHWASWSPIGKQLNFHQPESFGILEFDN